MIWRASFHTVILAIGVLSMVLLSASAQAAPEPAPDILFNVYPLKEENVEGPDVERTYFKAGSKRIVFGQPAGTYFRIQGSGLTVLFEDGKVTGEIHIGRSPFTSEFPLAENALKYREAGAKGTPAGASNIQVQQPVLDPYPYNGWKSLGFTWTYELFGRRMMRTVSYINLEIGTQLELTTIAEQKYAETVGKIAKDFMSSWWLMDD